MTARLTVPALTGVLGAQCVGGHGRIGEISIHPSAARARRDESASRLRSGSARPAR